jgi:hypothetical protein
MGHGKKKKGGAAGGGGGGGGAAGGGGGGAARALAARAEGGAFRDLAVNMLWEELLDLRKAIGVEAASSKKDLPRVALRKEMDALGQMVARECVRASLVLREESTDEAGARHIAQSLLEPLQRLVAATQLYLRGRSRTFQLATRSQLLDAVDAVLGLLATTAPRARDLSRSELDAARQNSLAAHAEQLCAGVKDWPRTDSAAVARKFLDFGRVLSESIEELEQERVPRRPEPDALRLLLASGRREGAAEDPSEEGGGGGDGGEAEEEEEEEEEDGLGYKVDPKWMRDDFLVYRYWGAMQALREMKAVITGTIAACNELGGVIAAERRKEKGIKDGAGKKASEDARAPPAADGDDEEGGRERDIATDDLGDVQPVFPENDEPVPIDHGEGDGEGEGEGDGGGRAGEKEKKAGRRKKGAATEEEEEVLDAKTVDAIRLAWMDGLADVLKDVEDASIDLADQCNDPADVAGMVKAAQRTTRALQALRPLYLGFGTGYDPELACRVLPPVTDSISRHLLAGSVDKALTALQDAEHGFRP